jgi:hypothetical protein
MGLPVQNSTWKNGRLPHQLRDIHVEEHGRVVISGISLRHSFHTQFKKIPI